MSVTTLLPNSGLISRGEASLIGNNGTIFSSGPTTGINSPAYYVKNGITSPDDTTYWTNTAISPGPPVKPHFYVGADKMSLSPSGLTLKLRGAAGISSYSVDNIEVWLKKEHNPTLASDIQVASGVSSVTISSSIANYSKVLNIIEVNRTAFESGIPNNYMCISGIMNFGSSSTASGTFQLFEMELELSGVLPTPWNSCNLFVQGLDTSSGNFDLYIAGPITSSGSFDLYTVASILTSGSHDLYTGGVSSSSGSFNLYIAGPITSSGSLDLFMFSSILTSGNSDLYTSGSILSSGNFDLYSYGYSSQSGSMNLFMQGQLGVGTSGITSLYTWSGSGSGLISQFDMILWNNSSFNPQNAMNLTLEGPSSIVKTGSMNLYLDSNTRIANQFNMYLSNNYIESSGWIPLYINTPAETEGSVPMSGAMNMVIWRDSDNTANWLPLYLQSIESGISNFPMYVFGNTVGTGSADMYVKGKDEPTNNITLYSHGY